MERNCKTIKHLWELTCILIIPLPYDLILTINEQREKSSSPIATKIKIMLMQKEITAKFIYQLGELKLIQRNHE